MNHLWKALIGISCLALLTLAIPSSASASELDKETLFTFSAPVELPGIALPAGTYMFKLFDPDGDRTTVGVFDQAGTTCYGVFLTIPDARVTAPDHATVRFAEGSVGIPPAISEWFYPGDSTGREFLYPAHRANG